MYKLLRNFFNSDQKQDQEARLKKDAPLSTNDFLKNIKKLSAPQLDQFFPNLNFTPIRSLGYWQFPVRKRVQTIRIETPKNQSELLCLHDVNIWIEDGVGRIRRLKTGLEYRSSDINEGSISAADVVEGPMKYQKQFTVTDAKRGWWEVKFARPYKLLRIDVKYDSLSNPKGICALNILTYGPKGNCNYDNKRNLTKGKLSIATAEFFSCLEMLLQYLDAQNDSANHARLTKTLVEIYTARKANAPKRKRAVQAVISKIFDEYLPDTPDFGNAKEAGLKFELAENDKTIQVITIGSASLRMVNTFEMPNDKSKSTAFKRKPSPRSRYHISGRVPLALNLTTHATKIPNKAKAVTLFGKKKALTSNGIIRIIKVVNEDGATRIVDDTLSIFEFLSNLCYLGETLSGDKITSDHVGRVSKLAATFRRPNLRRYKSFFDSDKDLLSHAIDTCEQHGKKAKYIKAVIFTRHGLQTPFSEVNDKYLARQMHKFTKWMDTTYNLPTFPLYGTLLGIHRENRFLPHDDDIDVATIVDLPDGHTPQSAVKEWKERIQAEHGYKCLIPYPESTNMHVNFPGHKMDLFFIFRNYPEPGLAYGHMERYELRPFPLDLLEPLSSLEFLGATYYAPGQIENFLKERYGPGWVTPDPTFEMEDDDEDDDD